MKDGVGVIQARANDAKRSGICHVNSKIFLYVPQWPQMIVPSPAHKINMFIER